MMTHSIQKVCAIVIGLNIIAACGGGGSGDALPAGVERDYLNVSITEYYFGTRDVGTSTTQTIELANWSGDIYPINQLTINGEDAEEFGLNFHGGISLAPSQKIAIDVTFTPVTEGMKTAEVDVDYDIIKQVTAEENINEQKFYTAAALEDKKSYKESLEHYQKYIDGKPVTANKKRAEIKVPVLAESSRRGAGPAFDLYVAAMNKREAGDTDKAVRLLEKLEHEYPDSYLADDAIYFKGYIELIDQEDYINARRSMEILQRIYPESTYVDTAIYSEGIALEELGQYKLAQQKFSELAQRHTSNSMSALNLSVAKDNFLSRMWFTRAKQAIKRVTTLSARA